MSERPAAVRVDGENPDYAEWRSKIQGELALARVPEFVVYKRPQHGSPPPEHDFLVTTAGGLCCFVWVKGFSPYHLKLKDVAQIGEWRWTVPASVAREARESPTPVVMFLFDADADADRGRYARLDNLPEPEPGARRVTVSFPVENTITPESLRELMAGMRRAEPAAG
jgi:hypothetical protein